MPPYLLMSAKQHENRQSTQPATENPPSPQAVMWCGFDENLEQGARCKSSITTLEIRAMVWTPPPSQTAQ
jgi:hypothetical protein